jgi:hypothetical protein
MKVSTARHLVVLVELPANQRKPDGERRDAEDHQQRHGVTTTTQVAVGSSNFIVVVHIARHGLRDSNPHQSARRTQSRGPYAAPVFYGSAAQEAIR